jgi:NAD(P)-dependent dehydrogenase (short-subunit alcohol dehydrogenase family)
MSDPNPVPSPARISLAVITGGSRGLGASMALHLADHGVDSIITYRRAAAEAREVVSRVEAKGRKAVALPFEAGDVATFGAFKEALQVELGRVWGRDRFDALVNNAGVGAHAPIAQTTVAQFDEMVNVHLKGPFFLTQALLPLIADGGRIINLSSGLTRFTFPGYGAYASMKGAVEVLTRYLAKELGARGISVNTLAPGAIATDFGGGAVRDNPQLNQMVASLTALGRAGVADDIGGAVALLLSPEGRWINGQRIEASGGMNL